VRLIREDRTVFKLRTKLRSAVSQSLVYAYNAIRFTFVILQVWKKAQSSAGIGGFIYYAGSICVNHLRSCPNHPPDVHQQVQAEVKSPKKQQYSPYGTMWLGVTPVPGTSASGSRSSQMLPPSLPPSTWFNSPALHLQMTMLPSPTISALPSPQLSALPSPLINTLPLSYRNHYPLLHPNQSPAPSTPHSLYVVLGACYNLFLGVPRMIKDIPRSDQ